MDIPKTYNPGQTENKWYKFWMEGGFFRSVPDERTPYTVVIPPPNVTGVLHMGHMLNNTIQDVLVRRARMQGKNACWVPGTDHASIATEARVVNYLKKKGINKNDLTREQFLKHAWEWNEKHGGIILEQLKKLGCSCDWDRTRFTMEDDLTDAVLDVFIDLHNKGYIYRGVRMVNWDPSALTALSDEEVVYKEVNSKLYFINYFIVDDTTNNKQPASSNQQPETRNCITIATTRPETILGDTAICVHPDDERYKHLVGKTAFVPLINRRVPVIADEYIDMEFGTGALKVTPAHDINDYNLGVKHGLSSINIFNDNGTLNENAQLYIGEDRFIVRKKIALELEEKGHLVKIQDIVNKVGYSERTDAVIEPKLSLQWFCNMKELAKPALENVMNDAIMFYPAKFKNAYRHWMSTIRDWCISRQLWWGQRVPAWYCSCKECSEVIMIQRTKPEKCINCGCSAEVYQDEDVLDTWFSAWLWPISVFDGLRDASNKDISYYYPTNDLVTAPEIMFFWVARMIMAGYEYRGKQPFKNVYYTGIVRDKLGRKMSKSLNNSPEPLDLIDQYGADGVRVGMLLCSPAGNDLLFDEKLCEQGRNFTNKLWNAFRLVNSWIPQHDTKQPAYSAIAVKWFESRFNEALLEINDHFSKFRISDALMSCYKLVWDDFCSWYLEMVKISQQQEMDTATHTATLDFFERILKVLHPFIPFITEEIWHLLRKRKDNDCIIISLQPIAGKVDKQLISDFGKAVDVITAVRNFRKDANVPNREALKVFFKKQQSSIGNMGVVLSKLCNLTFTVQSETEKQPSHTFIVGSDEYNIILSDVSVNTQEQMQKLRDELTYTRGFLDAVIKKLGNERFVKNAPEQVLSVEIKKKNDAEARIKVLKEQLEKMV